MKKVSRQNIVFGFLLLAASLVSFEAFASEPCIFMMGVWPDRVRFFDEKTEEFVGEFRLRHGAVTWNSGGLWLEAHTPDYRRFYLITERMETVEVVDTVRQMVVDEFKLSTPDRKVRIFGVAPDSTGKFLYLMVRPVKSEMDRFVPEDMQFILYDLAAHEIKKSFRLPDEIKFWFPPMLRLSPDGQSLFAFGEDTYELSTESLEIVDKIVLSKPLRAGYGPFEGETMWREAQPGIFYGLYRATDPFLKKPMVGVARLDLGSREVESFELGPELNVLYVALSPDGRRGYAGSNELIVVDMEDKRILKRKEGFEQGRSNNSLIVSADGKRLYVSGVGDAIHIYDTATLERMKSIFVGGDFMSPPFAFPRSVLEEGTDR